LKTRDLIRSLANDAIVDAPRVALTASAAWTVSVVVLSLIVGIGLGVRPDIGTAAAQHATALKLVITLSAALAGTTILLREAEPSGASRTYYFILLAGPAVLCLGIAFDLWNLGVSGWQSRLIGSHGLHCLIYIPALSTVPLAACLLVLRTGAPTRPRMAGVIAGIAAAGIGASFYALNCTDDSPLFVAFWYGSATVLVGVAGAIASHVFARW